MSVFNSSTNGGSGGGFHLGSGAATGASVTAGSVGGIMAQAGYTAIATLLFAVMVAFTCVMFYQAVVRARRRRRGAR